MKQIIHIMIATALLGLSSCVNHQPTISVTNPLSSDRSEEVVTVDIEDLNLTSLQLTLTEKESGKEVLCQVIDADSDGTPDAVAFQTSLLGNQTKMYVIKEGVSTLEASNVRTFARFVPERTDDFTWENDKVAYRTYGPEAQRLVEKGLPGGTRSSGIDCWLKKVDYSIIDEWYQGNSKEAGFYHIDHGQGLDNYHVGPSRGCGGTGVMIDNILYTSKNYVSYKFIKNGPITTSFELGYEPYSAGDRSVKENKHISIDMGSHFTKYVIYVDGNESLTTGVTLHENHGTISIDKENGWVNYYAPHFGENLSTSIVAHPDYIETTSVVESEVADHSHVLMHLKVIDGKVEFYSGFTWSGSKYFADNTEWEAYLTDFSMRIKNPIVVEMK